MGSPYAMAALGVPDVPPLFELNDIDALRSSVAHPADVVTRDRDVTQRWARTIFERGGWPIVGLWNHAHVACASPPELLTLDSV
jgi:hypothetical protein